MLLVFVSSAQARDLTFEDRVKAQEVIERVYYSHRIDAAEPFEAVVTKSVLEGKVIRYLAQSVVLEAHWGVRVTADMLKQEMERQARETRMPDRLRELYLALGNDTVLIQECMARPALVDRLVRSRFATDAAIQREARQTAESLRRRLLDGQIDLNDDQPGRSIVDFVRIKTGENNSDGWREGPAGTVRLVSGKEFDGWRKRLPRVRGEVGPVQEQPDAFVIRVLLDQELDRLRVVTFSVPKQGIEEWLRTAQSRLDPTSVSTVGSEVSLPTLAPRDRPLATRVPNLAVPARYEHSAVCTGTEMIVWGGSPDGLGGTGARYDLAMDDWTIMTNVDAPSPRVGHTAVWTGTEMIVWGGLNQDDPNFTATGGRYDPTTDTWTPTANTGAPLARVRHGAVWTGRFMVVWGGYGGKGLKSGGRYDPISDKWLRVATGSAPSGREGFTVIWTGKDMIVWGGLRGSNRIHYLNTGGKYDPNANTWSPTSTMDAPTPRYDHTAVWTGTEMIVWGGAGDDSGTPGTGGRYDPVTDTWSATTRDGAPLARVLHHGAWTGNEMIVWGGQPFLNTGGRYDPASDHWVPTSTVDAPAGLDGQSAIWCGNRFIVWGGNYTNQGGSYDPITDSWTPTGTELLP